MPFFIAEELQAKRLTGHDHFWRVIRKLGARGREFTIAEVAAQTNAHTDSVGDFIRRLTRSTPPIAEPAGKRPMRNPHWAVDETVPATTYRLLQSPGETPSLRRDGTPGQYGRRRQNMWNILRGPQARAGVDAKMLTALASTASLPISLGSAKEYLQRLDAAGYLLADADPAKRRLTVYRLRSAMNTGPEAPKLIRGTVIYDPNRRTLMGPFSAGDEP